MPSDCAFGDLGIPGKIKKGTNIEYEITLIDFETVLGDKTSDKHIPKIQPEI